MCEGGPHPALASYQSKLLLPGQGPKGCPAGPFPALRSWASMSVHPGIFSRRACDCECGPGLRARGSWNAGQLWESRHGSQSHLSHLGGAAAPPPCLTQQGSGRPDWAAGGHLLRYLWAEGGGGGRKEARGKREAPSALPSLVSAPSPRLPSRAPEGDPWTPPLTAHPRAHAHPRGSTIHSIQGSIG